MRNKSLDILKLIASFFVVFIHVSFSGYGGNCVSAVASFAVPVFYICSGYFSYNAIVNRDSKKLLKRCIPLIKILIVSLIVFALCSVFVEGNNTLFSDLFSRKALVRFFVFGNFEGLFVLLWFLPSLIYTYIAFALLVKLRMNKIIKLLPLLVILSIAACYLLFFLKEIKFSNDFVRNFLFRGIPFFSIGYLLNEYKQKLKNIKNYIWVIVILFGIGMILIENLIDESYPSYGIYFGSILLAVGLFEMFSRFDIKIKSESVSYCISKLSLYIYILHMPVNSVLCHFGVNKIHREIYPVTVLLVAAAISILVALAGRGFTKIKKSKA